jgi:YVTN family beta-propeller protein
LAALLLLLTIAQVLAAQTKAQQDRPVYREASSNAGSGSSAGAVASQRFEKEGIAIEFSIRALDVGKGIPAQLVAGADALVRLRLSDTRTGEPITGVRPNGWMVPRRSERVPNEAECKDKIRSFLGGLLSARAEIDLNGYTLVTLNHDNSLTFINPQTSFNLTKLEGIVPLPSPGADMVLSKDKNFIYVTLPEQPAVAVVNAISKRLLATIPTGTGKPRRIALQPDGRKVWVGIDDSSTVAVIDAGTNRIVSSIEVGAGLHNIAFTSDSHFAFVTNSADNTVSAIDTKTLSKVADFPAGKTPVAVAYSTASRLVYVASINGAAITVIDPERRQVIQSLPLKRGVVALKFDPSGRYGFAVNQLESEVSIIDASTNRIVADGAVAKGADQVTFTTSYAYIRGTETEKFSLLEMSDVKKGKVAPVSIQAGRLPPSAFPDDIGVADMIAPTPEGNSVMIANAADQMIYYYVEGMMAPMGTLDNYKRRARALMLIDRSLLEVAPGVYSSPVKFKHAGTFDVPVLIDQPRIANCFEVKVGDAPDAEKVKAHSTTVVEPMFKGQTFAPGTPVTLKFKISDSITDQVISGLKDVRVLVFEPPGIWQQRQWARQTGDGIYEVNIVFPRAGYFKVMTEIESRGVRFAGLPATDVAVVNERKSENPAVSKKEGAAR